MTDNNAQLATPSETPTEPRRTPGATVAVAVALLALGVVAAAIIKGQRTAASPSPSVDPDLINNPTTNGKLQRWREAGHRGLVEHPRNSANEQDIRDLIDGMAAADELRQEGFSLIADVGPSGIHYRLLPVKTSPAGGRQLTVEASGELISPVRPIPSTKGLTLEGCAKDCSVVLAVDFHSAEEVPARTRYKFSVQSRMDVDDFARIVKWQVKAAPAKEAPHG